MKKIILIFIVGLIAITGVSCTIEQKEIAYLEKGEDWINTLSFALAGLRIEDYQNAVYPNYEVIDKASQLEPYLRRLGSSIKKTTPPSGLVDVHRQLESLVADAIDFTANLSRVLTIDGTPMFYLAPERRTDSFETYPFEVENIFIEHDRIDKQIRDLKTIIATKLQGTTR